ncbi:MAG TPA: discoidin domain-containing protein [Actinophytocola sp.]|nr:discoidin domain-containing protein [Actinophytocola sp.]
MRIARLGIFLVAAIVVVPQVLGTAPARDFAGTGSDPHDEHHVVATAAAMVPDAPTLPRRGWVATATSADAGGQAANVLDGKASTIWHSKVTSPAAGLPQSITVDMRTTQPISGVVYTPRPGGGAGTVGRYEVRVSVDGTSWSAPVSSGTLADDASAKTISFALTGARFVRLMSLSEAGGRGPRASAAEIDVLGAPAPLAAPVPMPRTGWTASASDEETAAANNRASNVLDASPATIWHSKWSGTPAPLPHSITIDMKSSTVVSGLRYGPRDTGGGGGANGRIGGYRIAVSTDGTTFGAPVSTGVWADTAAVKDALFAAPVTARYVRLTGLTEAGGRGPWSSAAEIDLLGRQTVYPVPADRTGWTVTASDEETASENGRAINVLDGDFGSIWHSRWSGTAAPLPHTITLDLAAPRDVLGLAVTPRTGSPNGRIGRYEISVSTNGTTFGSPVLSGTWPDSAAEQSAVLAAPVQARYVRLTALSEAGGRGPWSSAAEINVLVPGSPPDASKLGKWNPVKGFPLVPVASATLPNNKLLVWSAYAVDNFGGANGYTQTAIYDLATGQISQREVRNTGHDMFCPGTSMLRNGQILISGGSNAGKATLYNPASDTWTPAADLKIPRGYQSQTTLSTGEAFTVGGSWSGGEGGKLGEVYNQGTNSWRTLTGVPADPFLTADPRGVYRADNHTWLFAAGGGRVFHAGPSKQMHWVTTTGNGSVTDAGSRGDSPDAMNGNAVMYDVDKILTLGGAPAYQDANATTRAYAVDISTGTASVQRVGDMSYARAFANSVVLPNGQVVVAGGQAYPVPFSDQTAIMTPELWDPATRAFVKLAPMAVPRTYHSVANLLPDGTVFTGGGGLCGSCATNHADGQILVPPYLLNPDGTPKPRPSITSAPTTAANGATVAVTTGGEVTSFALVRLGVATHSVDNDQRRVPLTPTRVSATSYRVTVPADPGVALPGSYLLFAMNAQGVPSVAKNIRIG